MIDVLLGMDAIGWDFDGTLIDHANSRMFHEFILAHPDKRHVILTFRTHGYQNSMFRDMLLAYPDAPGPDKFSDVKNIADKAWMEFTKYNDRRLVGRLSGPLTPWEEYYVEWKGMMCRDLNLPVLVDDMPNHVLPGCEKYNVIYINPSEL